jgi:3-oxoacyl-[acyl-carrier protein] reductase
VVGMNLPHLNKTVLVTGSRRGVGKLICDHFLANGAQVIGFARDDATIEHTNYIHMKVDLNNESDIVDAFKTLRSKRISIQIVINNAAVLTSQHAMIMPVSSARAMIDTNFLAPFIVSREAAKMMRKSKWGRIINIGSMAVKLKPVGDSVYAATKAALEMLASVMAKEFSSFGVTCNTLAISAIETDMLAQLPKDKVDDIVNALPIPRYAEAEDILNVIDFYASERSAYITAQSLYLGGLN